MLIPVTAPPVPVDDKPVMVFVAIFKVVAVPLAPTNNPVTDDCPVIFVIVFVESVVVLPKLDCKTFTALVPQVQLLNVFPVIVFCGVPPVPSLLNQPVIIVAPVTVIFEKLLLLF